MATSAELNLINLLDVNKIDTLSSIHTQYVVMVVKVSDDGRFVSVVDCTLEWKANPNGDTFMLNQYNKSIICSQVQPWVVNDVPVEQPYLRGQWQVNARPRVGDYGILSVFYHDIESWKKNGGFQSPTAIRIHALDSCSFRPGIPNHADVGAEEEGSYPSDDKMVIKGNGVSISLNSSNNEEAETDNLIEVKSGINTISLKGPGYEDSEIDNTIEVNSGDNKIILNGPGNEDSETDNSLIIKAGDNVKVSLTSPASDESEADQKVLVNVGSISISIKVPHEGDPVIDIECPTLNINGDVNVTGTVTADTDVIGGGVSLKNHTHDFPYSAGNTPTTGTTEVPTPQE